MRALAISLVAIIGLLLHGPPAARAGAPDPAVQAQIDEGARLFRAERFREALVHFEAAYQETSEHRLLYLIGRCHEELDSLDAALQAYRAFVTGDLIPPDARARAETAIRLIERQMSSGRLAVLVPIEGVEIFIDGEKVGVSPLDPVELSPGEHLVHVRGGGLAEESQAVLVPRGGDVAVTFATSAGSGGSGGGAEPADDGGGTVVTDDTSLDDGRSATPWQWVTLGTGAALGVAGGVLLYLGQKDHDDSGTTSDWSSRQSLVASGDDKKLAGYVLLGVGGAALVTSATLFVLDATVWADDEPGRPMRPAVWGGPTGVVFGFEGGW